MNRIWMLFILSGSLSAGFAQDAAPSRNDQPAVSTDTPVSAAPTFGATVTGEQDSPVGLFIMPWRKSAADGGAGRPVRFLDETLLPHDADEFHRQRLYHQALSRQLEKTGRITP